MKKYKLRGRIQHYRTYVKVPNMGNFGGLALALKELSTDNKNTVRYTFKNIKGVTSSKTAIFCRNSSDK